MKIGNHDKQKPGNPCFFPTFLLFESYLHLNALAQCRIPTGALTGVPLEARAMLLRRRLRCHQAGHVWFLEDAELSSCFFFFVGFVAFRTHARNYEASSPSVLTQLTFLQSNQEPTSTWLCNWIFLWPIWPSGLQNVGVKLLNPTKPPLASQVYSFWEGIYFPGVRIKWWLVTVP